MLITLAILQILSIGMIFWLLFAPLKGPQGQVGPRGLQGPQGLRGPDGHDGCEVFRFRGVFQSRDDINSMEFDNGDVLVVAGDTYVYSSISVDNDLNVPGLQKVRSIDQNI